VRVPFADVGPLKVESGLPDEKVLFLSDIFPTGYMAAENCDIQPGHIVAVWGCGPVGQFAIRSALLLGAHKVIAIDHIPERLQLASEAGAVTVSADEDVHEILKDMTGGRGPDACIDAVGMEAHGSAYDHIKQKVGLETDRPYVLRQIMMICRKGGTLSLPGVYAGFVDKLPFGAAFGKGLTLKMGRTNVPKYMRPLLELIEEDKIDPSVIITHRVPLANANEAYQTFEARANGCVKVVLKPQELPTPAREAEAPATVGRPVTLEEWQTPRSKRLQPK
jgi:threonine dehydrogenase-like Zn-dependent dehydrogenase